MRRLGVVFMAGALAASLAGCSGSASQNPTPTDNSADAAGAIATAELFFNSVLTGDGAVVCGLNLRNGAVVQPSDPAFPACVDAVKQQSAFLAPKVTEQGITKITANRVTVTGDTATVKVSDLNVDIFQGLHSEYVLRKIDGQWYMDPSSEQ